MCPIKFDLILPILNRKIGDKIRIRNMKVIEELFV